MSTTLINIKKCVFVASLTFLMAACNGNATNDDEAKAKQHLSELYQNAEKAFNAGDEDLAIAYLDSIKESAITDPEILKNAHRLRLTMTKNNLEIKIKELQENITADSTAISQLAQNMISVSLSGLDPYLTYKPSYDANFAQTSGISARIEPTTGQVNITASLKGKNGLRYMSLSSGNSAVCSDTIGKELVASMPSGDLATFSASRSFEIAQFADSISDPTLIDLTFYNGENKKLFSRKLTKKEFDGLIAAYEYTSIANRLRENVIQRSAFEDLLDAAQKQLNIKN